MQHLRADDALDRGGARPSGQPRQQPALQVRILQRAVRDHAESAAAQVPQSRDAGTTTQTTGTQKEGQGSAQASGGTEGGFEERR